MGLPKISVCITAYNQEKFIKQAVESVLNQTLLPFELLIIDDCSGDGTTSIIMDYALNHSIIRNLSNADNLGITKTRNIALNEAKGDYITFLDGDDYFLPDKLKEEFKLISEGNFDFAYSNFNIIQKDGKLIQAWISNEGTQKNDNLFIRIFSFDFPEGIAFRSELVKLDKWKEIGFFDENLEIWEDFDMRLRLTKKLKGINNPNISHVYRRHQEGLSSLKIKLYPFSLDYILKKNYGLLMDINKKDKKRIRQVFNELISNSYIYLASEMVRNEKISYRTICLIINYLHLSQKYNLNIKSLYSPVYYYFRTRFAGGKLKS